MPFQWHRGSNPFRDNFFGRLRLGPVAFRGKLVKGGRKLAQKIRSGQEVFVDGRRLEVQDVQEAQARLGDTVVRAKELLLVHPFQAAKRSEVDAARKALEDASGLSRERSALELVHPVAALALIPPPSADLVEPVTVHELGLEPLGGSGDLLLDVVFDQ